MAILEGIRIQNYRALKDVTLGKTFENKEPVLPRLMAVIGANGTGKSSLVDALGFLGDCLQEQANPNLRPRSCVPQAS